MRTSFLFALVIPIFSFFTTSGAAQSTIECECAALFTQHSDRLALRRSIWEITNDQIVADPRLLAPAVREYLRAQVREACNSSGQGRYTQQTLGARIIDRARSIESLDDYGRNPEYRACMQQADNRYSRRYFGERGMNLFRVLEYEQEDRSFSFDPPVQETGFGSILNDQGRVPNIVVGFVSDLLNVNNYMNGETDVIPASSFGRLVPWAFPNWPPDLALSEMSLDDYFEFTRAVVFSSPFFDTQAERSEDMARPTLSYCPGNAQWLTEIVQSERFGVAWCSRRYSRDPLAGIAEQLQMNRNAEACFRRALVTEGTVIADDGLREFRSQRPSRGFSALDECLAECRSPSTSLRNYNENYCEYLCYQNPVNAESILGNFGVGAVHVDQQAGECDNMNHAERDFCIARIRNDLERDEQECYRRFVFDPNLPDQLDWTNLAGAADCQLIENNQLRTNCEDYFVHSGMSLRSGALQAQETVAQCIQTHCGADERLPGESGWSPPMFDGPEEIRFRLDEEAKLEEARQAARQESLELRESVSIPAITGGLADLTGEDGRQIYEIKGGEANIIGDGSRTSHRYGSGADVTVVRTDGQPMTRQDYERVANAIFRRLPAGFQVFIEYRMNEFLFDARDINRINNMRASPLGQMSAEIAEMVSPTLASRGVDPSFASYIDVLASDVYENIYYYEFYTVNQTGSAHFFSQLIQGRTTPNGPGPTGTHIHVGRPSSLFKHLE